MSDTRSREDLKRQTIGFFTLPFEIRMMVYHHIAEADKDEGWVMNNTRLPSFLSASREVLGEAFEMYFPRKEVTILSLDTSDMAQRSLPLGTIEHGCRCGDTLTCPGTKALLELADSFGVFKLRNFFIRKTCLFLC